MISGLVQDLHENMDENLAWLTQKTKIQNANAIELNCTVVKKVATPPPPPPPPLISTSAPPLLGLSPLSSKKFCPPK